MLAKTVSAVLLVALMACANLTGASNDYTGNYAGSLTSANNVCGTGSLVLTLTQNGSVLSGTWTTSGFGGANCSASPYLNTTGNISGQAVGSSLSMTLSPATGNYNTFALLGTVNGNAVSGDYTVNNADFTTGTFTAAKQ